MTTTEWDIGTGGDYSTLATAVAAIFGGVNDWFIFNLFEAKSYGELDLTSVVPRVLVRGTGAGKWDGVTPLSGARLESSGSRAARANQSSRLTIEDLEVYNTDTSDAATGYGANVDNGATLTARRCFFHKDIYPSTQSNGHVAISSFEPAAPIHIENCLFYNWRGIVQNYYSATGTFDVEFDFCAADQIRWQAFWKSGAITPTVTARDSYASSVGSTPWDATQATFAGSNNAADDTSASANFSNAVDSVASSSLWDNPGTDFTPKSSSPLAGDGLVLIGITDDSRGYIRPTPPAIGTPDPAGAAPPVQAASGVLDGLIADPDTPRAYLVSITLFDPLTGGTVPLFLCQAPDTQMVDGIPFEPRVLNAIDTAVSMPDFAETFGGAAKLRGEVTILNPDGHLDSFLDYWWEGREIAVMVGAAGSTSSASFETVFYGIIDTFSWDADQIRLEIMDRTRRLQEPVWQTEYGGGGLLDGSADLKNAPKPLTIGHVGNMAPTLIDSGANVYAFSIRETNEATVYDKGVDLGGPGFLFDVYAWTPVIGQWVLDRDNAVFRLGAPPDGQITADVKGEQFRGYVETPAAVIRYIAEEFMQIDQTEIDGAAFDAVDEARQLVCGWTGFGDALGADIMDEVAASASIWWGWNREGKLTCGTMEFATPGDDLAPPFIADSLSRSATPRQTWRYRVGYKRAWIVQGDGDLAGSVTDDRREYVRKDFRHEKGRDDLIRQRVPQARDLFSRGLLWRQEDAAAEAARRFSMLSVRRNLYEVRKDRVLHRYSIGQTVRLVADRYDLAGGKPCMIVGLDEDSATGITSFRLWG